MKLVTVLLLVTVGICSYSATAFFLGSAKNAVPLPVDALPLLDPLKLLLQTLGISVEHLIEGLRKCVNELGPEASESVKKLLVHHPRTTAAKSPQLSISCVERLPAGAEAGEAPSTTAVLCSPAMSLASGCASLPLWERTDHQEAAPDPG
ncbi:hypothetical protein QTO34_016215, partial [Cnephaeus nilssonii]